MRTPGTGDTLPGLEDDGQDFVLVHDQQLVAIDDDFRPGVVGEQDAIPLGDLVAGAGAVGEQATIPHRQHPPSSVESRKIAA